MWGKVKGTLKQSEGTRKDETGEIWEVKVASAKYHLENAISALVDVQSDQARNTQMENAKRAHRELDVAIAGYMKFSAYKGKESEFNNDFSKLSSQLKGAEEISMMKVRAMRKPTFQAPPSDDPDANRRKLFDQNNSVPQQLPRGRMAPAPQHIPYGGLDNYTPSNNPYGHSGNEASGFQGLTAVGVQDKAIKIQEDGIKSLHHSEAITAKTNNIAADITVDLKKQAEVEMQISEDLNLLDVQLKQARREIYSFARNRSRDRCFLCVFIIMMLLLLTAFVLKLVNPNDVGSGNTDGINATTPIPPTPAP
eukprot:TRINITY_DN4003_c0_g1_i1.p1 TRINITY_DN4003_c0_g1~~TRINITY_DN4003_c0_g1_i1.p1  ORF type:complete len:319 (+),score=29.26 TRINITY_DN4003_c0_g1_i1:33-959(+)